MAKGYSCGVILLGWVVVSTSAMVPTAGPTTAGRWKAFHGYASVPKVLQIQQQRTSTLLFATSADDDKKSLSETSSDVGGDAGADAGKKLDIGNVQDEVAEALKAAAAAMDTSKPKKSAPAGNPPPPPPPPPP